MAEKDEPSLELPSFSLRRKRQPADVAHERPPVVEEVAQRPSRDLRVPALPAAALTGLAVGLAAIGLVRVGQSACEATSGTSSCGGGPGLLVLVVIVVGLTVLGAGLLRVLGVPHPGSTSTLAVGLATVVTLLLFADVLLERSGAVFAALTVLVAYVVAQAVTAASSDG
jgi:hypothetical protein